jgi:hypothetical protein
VIECPEIRELILGWFNAIQAGNAVTATQELLTEEPGFVAIGEHGEWVVEPGVLVDAYQALSTAGPPVIRVLALDAYSEGSVGWAADAVMASWRDGKRSVIRHTFILHREQGTWKVVHAHYSVVPSVSDQK